ncbi:MAG: hypothetical protein ACK2TZ_00485 [Anaerolineales bacterium]
MSESEKTLTCAFHPNRETQLRCNRCNKPICIKCATHTPTGYRCPECIRSQQKIFVTTRWYDAVITGWITGLIVFIGSLFAGSLGFYTILIALAAGYLAVLASRKAISNRRSPLLKFVMSACALLAGLLPAAVRYYGIFLYGGVETSYLLYLVGWPLAYGIIAAAYIFYQMRN